jgi:hypothetical protein
MQSVSDVVLALELDSASVAVVLPLSVLLPLDSASAAESLSPSSSPLQPSCPTVTKPIPRMITSVSNERVRMPRGSHEWLSDRNRSPGSVA